jgi:hypothetical protein
MYIEQWENSMDLYIFCECSKSTHNHKNIPFQKAVVFSQGGHVSQIIICITTGVPRLANMCFSVSNSIALGFFLTIGSSLLKTANYKWKLSTHKNFPP